MGKDTRSFLRFRQARGIFDMRCVGRLFLLPFCLLLFYVSHRYSVIVEHANYAFVYEHVAASAHHARQHVLRLPDTARVLGVAARDEGVYVLTETCLIFFALYQ